MWLTKWQPVSFTDAAGPLPHACAQRPAVRSPTAAGSFLSAPGAGAELGAERATAVSSYVASR